MSEPITDQERAQWQAIADRIEERTAYCEAEDAFPRLLAALTAAEAARDAAQQERDNWEADAARYCRDAEHYKAEADRLRTDWHDMCGALKTLAEFCLSLANRAPFTVDTEIATSFRGLATTIMDGVASISVKDWVTRMATQSPPPSPATQPPLLPADVVQLGLGGLDSYASDLGGKP